MTGYVAQRLVLMLVTLFAIITLTFFLMHAVPGGPFVSDKMMAPEIEAAINAVKAPTVAITNIAVCDCSTIACERAIM